MKYPNGEEIRVGDLIWWNGGEATAYVQSLLEAEAELREWELGEPHLFLANIHPYDPSSVAGIGYPQSFLEEDGIRPLTDDEKKRLATAEGEASQASDTDFSVVPHSIGVERVEDTGREWVFSVIDGEELVETARIPF